MLFLYVGDYRELQQSIDFHNCSALIVIPGCWAVFIGHTHHLRLWSLPEKNPSSHKRPFPQHRTRRSIHTHSCLHLNSFHWGGSGIWGIRAQRLILTSLKSVVWVQWKIGNILLLPDERIRVGFHCVMSSGEVLFFGEGERFSSTKQTIYFQFSRLTVHFLQWAVEEVHLVWLSSYSDTEDIYPAHIHGK